MTNINLMLQNVSVKGYDHDLRYTDRSHNDEMLSNVRIKQK